MLPLTTSLACAAMMAAALRVAQLGGDLGLLEVVEAGGAAADPGVGQRHHREAVDLRQQPPRGGSHLLAVQQVAGVLVGRGDRCGQAERVAHAEPIQVLGDVERGRVRRRRGPSSTSRNRRR